MEKTLKSKTIDLDMLVDAVGDAHFVLLGEATHGTSEFYQWRSKISKKLILIPPNSLLFN